LRSERSLTTKHFTRKKKREQTNGNLALRVQKLKRRRKLSTKSMIATLIRKLRRSYSLKRTLLLVSLGRKLRKSNHSIQEWMLRQPLSYI
jgi:hypothetical protein